MSTDFIEATAEVAAVNATAALVAINSAKWGAYIGDPGNIVTLCVSAVAIVFTVVRTTHYYLLIKDRNENRKKIRTDEGDME